MSSTLPLRRRQRLEVYYKKVPSSFTVTSTQEDSKLQLVNSKAVVIEPFKSSVVPLGVYVKSLTGYATLLLANTYKNVTFHPGLIDPNYMGELKLICNNNTDCYQVVPAGRLRVSVVAFTFCTPILMGPCVLSPPQYSGDAGYDFCLDQLVVVLPLKAFSMQFNIACPVKFQNFTPIVLGRSGLAARGLSLSPYMWKEDVLKLSVFNHTAEAIILPEGSRICQVVFMHNDHLPKPRVLAKLVCQYKLLDIPFRQSKISFIDIQKDRCTSTSTLFQDATSTTAATTNAIRGNKGLGSSGV
ncbi:orf54 [Alcelaphine gammaherpesvirus 2]|uniref:Orf54 n=1 Tax=Alcelaphine gammaherpesvirus 2 TaxID=138184 RepID=A0A068AAL8_9GAMA|nr:orf54 [Alcelaphine gammaherpesvirus 2]AIA62091.1 orf54 [Alcelaphine gammaherpesvirus 2]